MTVPRTNIEVLSSKLDKELFGQFSNTITTHTTEEIRMLLDDAAKRKRYIETYRDVLIPRLREMKDVILRNGHLLNPDISLAHNPMVCRRSPSPSYRPRTLLLCYMCWLPPTPSRHS